jgi:ribosomal protein S18 acetylase RimI-like enzyme
MDDATLLSRMWVSMDAVLGTIPPCSPGGRLVELPGVRACVVPAVGDRSIFNSVTYEHAAALEAAIDQLADIYERAGVSAWTVWVHPGDSESSTLLERAGHVLDADPAAMAMELAGYEGDGAPAGVDWEAGADPAVLARLNDAAYGYGASPFATALGAAPGDLGHRYVARLDGEPAACVMALDRGGDACIAWVATLPESRGRGLATALMRQACADARERGCETTSLQATKAGEPLYASLGYRKLGNIEMWERRAP